MPSGRPTNSNDVAWDKVTISRGDIDKYVLANIESQGSSVISIAFSNILDHFVPYASTIAGFADSLSNRQKKQLMADVYRIMSKDLQVTAVVVKLKYEAYQKGGAGYFWLASNDYKIVGPLKG